MSIFVKTFKMKKALSLLVIFALFNACDDGNLTQEDISFEEVTATQSCTNNTTNSLIYKLKDQEALLLEIPTATFTTEPTPTGQPIELNIGTTANRVVYRFYNGIVAIANICETIAPATPVITDQWVATDGKIQIETKANKTINETTGSTKISGYNHSIVLKNVTFAKSSGTQVYDTFPFGNYTTAATNLPFNFQQVLTKCTSSNNVYKFNTAEAFILNIDPSLIINEVTPLNTPRTAFIGTTTTNTLTYRLFTGGLITNDYFCQTTTPTTPTIVEEWTGIAGITGGTTGIIEVTTTTSGQSFKHTIVLKNVSLKKGNNDFNLGTNYVYGELFTLAN